MNDQNENTEPFIEFGIGWAKVHFRREVTDEDRARLAAAIASQTAAPAQESVTGGILTFGAIVENIAASDRNPIKRGIFIRKTSAKMAEYATKEGCHSTPLDNLRALAAQPAAPVETKCARCGSIGDVITICAGCQSPVSRISAGNDDAGCGAAVITPWADQYNACCYRSKPDALKLAALKALNYIENTEDELGMKLSCGDALREALK